VHAERHQTKRGGVGSYGCASASGMSDGGLTGFTRRDVTVGNIRPRAAGASWRLFSFGLVARRSKSVIATVNSAQSA